VKKLEIIVRPEKFGEVVSALHGAGVMGMTVTDVRGQGRQRGVVHYYRGAEYRVDLVMKVKVEAVVPDALVEPVVEAVCAVARTGEVGDGKIFISEVLDAVRVRTGERGDLAL